MALNGLVTASADKTAAHRWWNDMETGGPEASQEIQQTIQYVQNSPSPFFVVHWQGYAGGDPDFELYDLAKQPTSVNELAQAADNPRVVLEAEDGYWSWTSKEGLLKSLLEESHRDNSDGSEFQSAENFESPVDLPDFDELHEQAQADEDEDNTVEASSEKTAGPFDLTNSPSDFSHGAPSNEGPDDDGPAPDEETTESIISHASNVLQDASMKQEDRLIRVYSEVGQFLENKGLMPGHIAAERTASTRQLFDKFVSRKPETWEQARKVDWSQLSPEQQAAIKALPLLELPPNVEPMSNEIDQFFPQDKTGDEPIEWLVDTFGGGHFYVNTEGYTYARYAFQIVNYPEDETTPTSTEGRVPMNASEKTAGSDYARKQELMTPDGYEIESYNPYADATQARRFTVWPPEGNAVGDYSSLEEATTAIDQWKQFGKPEWLLRDGGARFQVKSSEKTADRMNVENPEQALRDNPDKYVVHVALQALEGLAGGKVNYTNIKPAEAVLAKILKAGGVQYSEFTQLGYDDISFEVKDQAAAIKATDYLNNKLPKSTHAQGYGYGTAEPAQAWAYIQDSDAHEGDEYSHPGDWHYPESTL